MAMVEASAGDTNKSPSGNAPSLEVEIQEQLTWDDPREMRNPSNWSIASKVYHTMIPSLLAFVITFSTSITVPATALIMEEFNVSRTVSLLPLTLYTCGIALGPLFIAPFSEVFGRKWVYVLTSSCLLAFIGGASAAQNISTLLVCRFLAGTLGSAGIAVGAGSIVDIWQLNKTGTYASLLFILGPFLGPTLGPLAGAYILQDRGFNWRWTQYLLLVVEAPIWLGCVMMKETSRTWILRDRNQSTVTWSKITSLIKGAVLRPIMMLFTELVVSSLAIYSAYAYAMIFSYFGSSAYTLQLFYGFNLREVGLSFISVIIGYILATVLHGILTATLYMRACRASPSGKADPEHRLYSAFVGSIFIPASLFWYAWEAHEGGSWAAIVGAGIPFGLGSFCLFLSVITYMVEFYGPRAAASGMSFILIAVTVLFANLGSALAANGMLRYTLGAVFPLFTVQMYENLGVHWAGSVFAFLSLLLLPIPWLLFKYGSRLREQSKFVVMVK